MKLRDYWGNPIRKDAYIIRATEIGQFLNCPRSWMFGTHNGLNLEPVRRVPKLRFGTIWHSAMEAIYEPSASADPFTVIDDAFAEERQVFGEFLGVEAFDPDIVEQISQEETLARQLLTAYEEWRNTTAEPPDSWLTMEAAERRYVIPVEGTRAYIAVKFDGEGRDPQGGYWVLEHKTRGKNSDVTNPPELELDIQMGVQLLVASFVKENVRGVIYNLARKQAPGPRVKKDIFGRHKVNRTPHMLDTLYRYVTGIYSEMRQATNMIKADWEYAAKWLRYNPQPVGYCGWGCNVKEICESLNRGEDVDYLIQEKLAPREKNIWEVLEEELQQD